VIEDTADQTFEGIDLLDPTKPGVRMPDHFSQTRMFWRSMSAVEQDHIMQAYTFELGKCYELAVKERKLLALANVDADLCARVAQGLGLAAPEPTEDVVDREPSPVLSQLGGTWPVGGRIVGIVVDADAGLDGVEDARRAVIDAGGLPLVVAAHGGPVDEDGTQAQRTFLTARSVELDAVLVAGCPPPAPDALPVLDAKAGNPEDGRLDLRVALMLKEAYRHAKPIGAWGGGRDALAAAGVPPAPGITLSDEPCAAVTDVLSLNPWTGWAGDLEVGAVGG